MAEWVLENLSVILTGSGVTAIGTWLYLKLQNKILPSIVVMFKNILVAVFQGATGMSENDAEAIVDKLPFIERAEEGVAAITQQNATKILSLQQAKGYPGLTEEEEELIDMQLAILLGKVEAAATDTALDLINKARAYVRGTNE